MIYDLFENLELYFDEDDPIYKAAVYARDFDLSKQDGRYDVEGDDIYALVQSYQTAPHSEKKFEAHKKHIDVQVIREGEEAMDVALGEKLEVDVPYNQEKDVEKYKEPKTWTPMAMNPGKFIVFFPQDVHRPNCQLKGPTKNRKICMKVKL